MSEAPEAAPEEAPVEAPAAPEAPSEDPLLIIADAIENGQMSPIQQEFPMESQAEEAPKEEAKEEAREEPGEEPEGSLASSWKAIKEAEVKNTRERAEVKAELEQLKKLQAESSDKFSEVKKAFEENPFDGLKKFGLTPDDIIERVLNDGNAGAGEQAGAAKRAEEQKFSDIHKTIEEQQKLITQTQEYLTNQKAEEAHHQFTSQVSDVLKDPEFSLVADHDNIKDDVWNRATAHYQQTGEILTPRESLGKLQSEFREALKQLASYQSTKAYMKELLGEAGTAQAIDSDKSPTPQDVPGYAPRTLTNSMSSQQPTPQPRDQPLTEYEELMEAAKLI